MYIHIHIYICIYKYINIYKHITNNDPAGSGAHTCTPTILFTHERVTTHMNESCHTGISPTPDFIPNEPVGSQGHTCIPNILLTLSVESDTPSSNIASPPAPPSSARLCCNDSILHLFIHQDRQPSCASFLCKILFERLNYPFIYTSRSPAFPRLLPLQDFVLRLNSPFIHT